MDKHICTECAGLGVILAIVGKDRLEIQRCDSCLQFSTDNEAVLEVYNSYKQQLKI